MSQDQAGLAGGSAGGAPAGPFVALINELQALSDAIHVPPSPNQAFDASAAGGASLREVLNMAAGKVAHEVIRTTLVLRSGSGVEMIAVVSLFPPLLEAIGQFVSAVQLITEDCSSAFRTEVRGAGANIMKGLLEMFGPLASLTAGIGISSEAASADGSGGGGGGLSSSPSMANAILKAACSRLAPSFLLHAGQISRLTEAIPRLPPDDLQALRRALLSCGKLLKSTLGEVAEEQGLTKDKSFNPSTYALPSPEALAALEPLPSPSSADTATAAAPEDGAAGAGAGEEKQKKSGDDEQEEVDDEFGDDEDEGPRLPSARHHLFVRAAVVALHSLFAVIKAFQAPVDRTGAALKKAQALKGSSGSGALALEQAQTEAASAGSAADGGSGGAAGAAAAGETSGPVSPLRWMDAAHAALAKTQYAVIDFSASANDYHASAAGLEELRKAVRDTEEACRLLQELTSSSDSVVSVVIAEAGSSEGVPAHDGDAERTLVNAVARAMAGAKATLALAGVSLGGEAES